MVSVFFYENNPRNPLVKRAANVFVASTFSFIHVLHVPSVLGGVDALPKVLPGIQTCSR